MFFSRIKLKIEKFNIKKLNIVIALKYSLLYNVIMNIYSYRWRKLSMRMEFLLNDEWLFHKGDIKIDVPIDKGPIYAQSKTERRKAGPASYYYNDKPDRYCEPCDLTSDGWHKVDLPNDYIIAQDNDKNQNNALGYFKYDNAWYRKHFTLSKEYEDKRVLLRFDGIAGKSTIYLNGCLMHHNFSAYNTFELDISDYVYFDKENIIAVYVNTEEFEGWWYQGGGIYRDVWLTVTENVAIDLWGVYAPYEKVSQNEWQVNFETTVVNTSFDKVNVIAKSYIIDKDGKTVAESQGSANIELRDKGVVKYIALVKKPLLWDCDNPNLYTVKTVLLVDENQIDENFTRIGFRTVEISVDKGLLLNGKKTIIKGVCAHQDFGITGIAVTENIARYKVQLMKQMGANGYRTSHYQQTSYYMDAFDEMGFLVMNESRWFESTKESFEQIESLVKRDRNRPSVIFWSTSNEEPNHITNIGEKIHKAIVAHIRKFDKTRYITLAEDRTPETSKVFDHCDVVGINYNLNIYDDVHAMRPNKALFSSECCATGTSRDWNFPSDNNGRLRDKDVDTNHWFLGRSKTWKFLMQRPYVIGAFQWAAVEHRGEATWPRVCSVSGALDLFLQKKGAFYQNKSIWTDEPMVHIVPHWNFSGMEGREILVTVYTNCDELELFLNGESFGKKSIEKYGFGEWNVPYTQGELIVEGYRDGVLVAEHKRITTGKPSKLKLSLVNDVVANGRDVALFLCECVDSEGNIVPDAAEFVKFSAETPAVIIGTGSDNCDHISVALAERKMYMGKICVAVKPQKDQEKLVLTAMSDNCGCCSIEIDF